MLPGATAGLRAAIEDGTISSAALAGFKNTLCTCPFFSPPPEFQLLSGEDEAQSEHMAACYIAAKLLPPECAPVGLISGGGKSSQFAFYSDPSAPAATLMELRADWFKGIDTLTKNGIQAGLEEVCERLQLCMSKTGLLGRLRGTFFGIEMFGGHCEKAGLGGRLVTKAEAVSSVRQKLADWKVAAESGSTPSPKTLGEGVMYAQILEQLSLLHESAYLYCATRAEILPSVTLKIDWAR